MPPQSRGGAQPPNPPVHSHSSPNLPTLRDFGMKAVTSPLASSPDDTIPADENIAIGKEPYSSEEEGEQQEKRDRTDHGQPTLHERRFYANRSISSNTFLQPSPSQLFPPFYGRPTTPLPPSPSLTSLLRPPFSTHTSHHTTPESSDVESTGGASTSAVVEKSAQAASTIPRASPKVPSYEYYGFALYLASSAGFLMYILWSYLPSPFLHQLGIYYYPNRWWALAVPAWLVVTVIYIYVALASYNTGYLTLPMQSIENLVDEAAHIAIVDREGKIVRPKKTSRFTGLGKCVGGGRHSRQSSAGGMAKATGSQGPLGGKDVNWGAIWDESTDAVMDIPIGGVCEILYGAGRQVH